MNGIIGIGNTLRGDDGIGVILAKKMERKVPSNVRVFDAGSGIIDILHILENLDKAIIVDAVHFGGKPGELKFFEPKEAKSLVESKKSHDLDLLEVLELSDLLEELPKQILIMGIEPKNISLRKGLSSTLENKIPELTKKLYEKAKTIFEFENMKNYSD